MPRLAVKKEWRIRRASPFRTLVHRLLFVLMPIEPAVEFTSNSSTKKELMTVRSNEPQIDMLYAHIASSKSSLFDNALYFFISIKNFFFLVFLFFIRLNKECILVGQLSQIYFWMNFAKQSCNEQKYEISYGSRCRGLCILVGIKCILFFVLCRRRFQVKQRRL